MVANVQPREPLATEQLLDRASNDVLRELAIVFVEAVDAWSSHCATFSGQRLTCAEATAAIRSRLLAAGLRIPEAR